MHRRTVLMGLAASALAFNLPTAFARTASLNLLATTYPVYQLVRNIARGVDGVQVELLIPAGTGCPHDYAPSPADMQKLARASIIILNGLGMELMLDETIRRITVNATPYSRGFFLKQGFRATAAEHKEDGLTVIPMALEAE